MKDPIIQLKGLTKLYGAQKAVDHLDLDIYKGEIFGLLGPNGAGKTTTILMMLGLTEPAGGSALVCGYNATRNPLEVKRKVGYMPDSVGFYDHMSAAENLQYIGRLNGIPEAQLKGRVAETLEIVGLTSDSHKPTAAFSRGMKQRLGLADVLLKQPEVIILDEPTLGIDPAGVKEFLTLIKQLSRQQGLTVLLSSHHLHHVQQVCDRVGIFVEGKLLAAGNLEKLAAQLFGKAGYITAVTLEEPVAKPEPLTDIVKNLDGVEQIDVHEHEIDITCSRDMTPDLVRYLVKEGCNITRVNQKNYGLEDIYQKYFESAN
ncbi:ABC-2 type transport system ATP-binding protein [Mucilaginibacter yixingensis]|uniref:ABC-2 type transport system ATP-binding protein n=1 Tax=Mucilaginibacter yixingensis TaxID=1295612 RepID=A0A2T5JEC4_9SPHI|nr:ABC transporter ATP-binding protein [Mucilaginibacter yixingensis]PTR00109.1 ABC-2 type transport system ATP-binding protein [Mucilaginibacter yixingensis]